MQALVLILKKVIFFSILILLPLVFSNLSFAQGQGKLSSEQRLRRLDHAKELLGKTYKNSVVKSGEQLEKINNTIYRWTADSLPKKFKKESHKIAQAVIDEAHKHSLDPVFLMAVIKTESGFNPKIVGGVGEIGLMQIRPETAEWIIKKLNLKKADLFNPVDNIRVGAAYFSYLREHFDDHARLYVAAYNMGPGNVKNLRQNSVWPKEYPSRVMGYYVDFYSELHAPKMYRVAKLDAEQL